MGSDYMDAAVTTIAIASGGLDGCSSGECPGEDAVPGTSHACLAGVGIVVFHGLGGWPVPSDCY